VTQDLVNSVASFVLPFSIVVMVLLSRRARMRKRIVITDFRRGVHFVGGVFSRVLEAGSYSFNPRKEQVFIVDMRPQPILMERIAFRDALQQPGVISFAVELLVRDPQLAAGALRDQVKDSYIIARDTLRSALSRQIFPRTDDLANLANTVATAIRAELGKVGMDISNPEITEFWSNSPALQDSAQSASTVVQ
jgi:hypothetical protein